LLSVSNNVLSLDFISHCYNVLLRIATVESPYFDACPEGSHAEKGSDTSECHVEIK